MKKQGIIYSLIGIILISTLLFVITSKNEKKYIEKDGIYFALTLNGIEITDFPDRGNYTVNVDCQNGRGRWLPDEWKFILDEISGRVSCDIDFNTQADDDLLINIITAEKTRTDINAGICSDGAYTSKDECEAVNSYWWGVFEENGLRYEGKYPENYVWFNNELWRIIGYLPTKDVGGNDTNLVKIIRNDGIGLYARNTSSSSAFVNSNYDYLLNQFYYNKLNATNTSYCYAGNTTLNIPTQCDFREIGLNLYSRNMIEPVQWAIGTYGTSAIVGTQYTNEIKTWTNVEGGINVGLMSASDYAYAPLTADCNHSSIKIGAYNTATCAGKNWLFIGAYEWTLNPTSTSAAWKINYRGGVETSDINYSDRIRPVVYLNPLVYTVSGDGSITNPYILAKRQDSSFYIGDGDQEYTSSTAININLNVYNQNATQYCISEDSTGNSCTWKSVTTTEIKESFTLSSGDGEKVVYALLRDSNGILIERLYDTVLLDTTAPVINGVVNTVSTIKKISVSVDATDLTEVSKYYYSIDNGNYVESDSNVYTFTELNTNTSYTIKVYAKDIAGNQSEVITNTFSTKELTTETLYTSSGGYNPNFITKFSNGVSITYNLSDDGPPYASSGTKTSVSNVFDAEGYSSIKIVGTYRITTSGSSDHDSDIDVVVKTTKGSTTVVSYDTWNCGGCSYDSGTKSFTKTINAGSASEKITITVNNYAYGTDAAASSNITFKITEIYLIP